MLACYLITLCETLTSQSCTFQLFISSQMIFAPLNVDACNGHQRYHRGNNFTMTTMFPFKAAVLCVLFFPLRGAPLLHAALATPFHIQRCVLFTPVSRAFKLRSLTTLFSE